MGLYAKMNHGHFLPHSDGSNLSKRKINGRHFENVLIDKLLHVNQVRGRPLTSVIYNDWVTVYTEIAMSKLDFLTLSFFWSNLANRANGNIYE